MNSSLSFLSTEWAPVLASSEDSELVKTLQSEEFTESHKKMMEAFDRLEPVPIGLDGDAYIPLSEKLRLLEESFPFQTFYFSPQIINMGMSDTPICSTTLLVLTDSGYRPWFSRMGMGDYSIPGTDGLIADAESSAKRRILIALGMGTPGEEKVGSERSVARDVLERYLNSSGEYLRDIVTAYVGQASSSGDEQLAIKTSQIKKLEDSTGSPLTIDQLKDNDVKLLSGFVSKITK